MQMKVISTNISEAKTIFWQGRAEQTGIFKKPVNQPIFLDKENVENDVVVDRKHHGGLYKASYLFGANYYDDWKKMYPDLDWEWGMFGENLTIAGLDESSLHVGSTYQLGKAIVQITEPRQPCYKLGIKFGNQKVIQEFLDYAHPGSYIKVIIAGSVAIGDTMQLLKPNQNAISILQLNTLIQQRKKDSELLKLAIANDAISPKQREKFKKHQ